MITLYNTHASSGPLNLELGQWEASEHLPVFVPTRLRMYECGYIQLCRWVLGIQFPQKALFPSSVSPAPSPYFLTDPELTPFSETGCPSNPWDPSVPILPALGSFMDTWTHRHVHGHPCFLLGI